MYRARTATPPEPGAGSERVGISVESWLTLPSTIPGQLASGGTVSMRAAIVWNACVETTGVPAAYAFTSGVARLTFGLGDGGFGETMPAIQTVSWVAPVPITSRSPAERPVVLERRIAVAPAAAAWFKVVFEEFPSDELPE